MKSECRSRAQCARGRELASRTTANPLSWGAGVDSRPPFVENGDSLPPAPTRRMDEDGLSTLKRLLAERLKGVQIAAPETTEADYDAVFARLMRRVRLLKEAVMRNKERVEDRYTDLADQPQGRQETVLANSSPLMLHALAHILMRKSYEHRFDDVRRSLAMAQLAYRAARAVARTEQLSPESASDLVGESLGHLGNALRLNSDLLGAERALSEAETELDRGTRDRSLRAYHLSFVASLRQTQGRARDAADLFKREAAIWRLLKDSDKLGRTLISWGLAACWTGDTLRASRLVREGAELVEDDRVAFVGLVNLAEALARDGDGFQAWQLLCTGDLLSMTAEMGDGLTRRLRWVKAIAYRTNGELPYAERLLTAVRDEYIENQQPLRAAFASLDLLAALAAQGKHGDLIPLAEATHRILVSEGLEQKALAAFMILHRAALAEQLTEELAVKVANFIQLCQHNREARFE